MQKLHKKFDIRTILYWYLTLGPIGYFPAPGTLATFFTMLVLFFIPVSYVWFTILVIASIIYGYFVINSMLKRTTHKDPSYIVLDEVIGSLMTLYFIPKKATLYILGFALFRFFDITKLGPIGWAEKIKGSSGILLDDMVAGIISNLILQLVFFNYGYVFQ